MWIRGFSFGLVSRIVLMDFVAVSVSLDRQLILHDDIFPSI